MFAFYTFLSILYNCLLKFILFMILLGGVQTFLEEVLKIAHLPPKSGLAFTEVNWTRL